MKAELKRAGVPVVAEYQVMRASGPQDTAAVAADLANASLRFNVRGVNRVLPVDIGGELTGLFMFAADAQGFRPTYGLTTANGPAQLGANVAASQLRGAVGIGWSPTVDVFSDREGALSQTHGLCTTIFRDAGAPVGGRGPLGQGITYGICDAFLITRRALQGSRSVTSAALRSRLTNLGSAFTASLTFGTRLLPGRNDGASAYRTLRFDTGCRCFEYTSGLRDLP